MRLYFDYYKDLGRGFTDDEFRRECEEALPAAALRRYLIMLPSTVKPDYNKYLDYAGLYLTEEAPAGNGWQSQVRDHEKG